MARRTKFLPQLATLVQRAPSGPQWIHELKFDGYRIGCTILDGAVRLDSRRNRDWTAELPEIVAAAGRLPARSAVLDGEVTVVAQSGLTSFQALQNVFSGGSRHGLTYFVFDLLHLDGVDLSALPLEERKRACEALLRQTEDGGQVIRYSQHFEIDGPAFLERACALGAKGIVSKRRDQPHRPGRSDGWQETKCLERQRFVIAGFSDPAAARSRAQRARRTAHEATRSAPTVRGIPITTPERSVYPQLGFTKLDLATFYAHIADWMLPYIANRPLTLVRCERGVRTAQALRSECRFLPHDPGWYRWASAPIRRIQIQEQKKLGEYLIVDSPEGVVALAQGDIIEIHAWNSTADRLETPDRLVLDLDPGDGVEWAQVVACARRARDVLASLGLQCWPKLTGGKGVHVVLPFEPEHTWDEVYALAHRIAEAAFRSDPAGFTLDFSRHRRDGKVLIDYKRNHRGAVAVAAYSARARPQGTVGIPLSWRELAASRAADRWTVKNLLQRLTRLQKDPWRDFWTCRQRLVR